MAAGEGLARPHVRDAFVLTVVSWAVVATALNVPWFYRQMARFRRYVPAPAPGPTQELVVVSAVPADVTHSAT
jgi:hypothetical protein